jgi:hypothetical protein
MLGTQILPLYHNTPSSSSEKLGDFSSLMLCFISQPFSCSSWHLPLAILLHLSNLVFNNNGLVDHVLEVGVVGVKQLELNVIIPPVQEHVLFLLVRVDVVRAYLATE